MSSKYLIQEHPIMVLPSLATQVGLNEAIVLQQVHYWLEHNRRDKKKEVYLNGKWWTYGSYPQWREKNFPWWSESTVKRAFLELEKLGLLISRQIDNDRDRSKWYTIDYKALNKLSSVNDAPGQNEPMDEVILDSSTNPNWSDPLKETKEETREEKEHPVELPPHLRSMQNGLSTNKLAYLDTWRDAHDGVKPAALKGNERMNALDDVDDLMAMECSLDDLTAYVKQRQKDGKSTVWRFMIQDIHVYLNNKNKPAAAPADSIDFDNPPLDHNGNPMIYVQEGWITRDEWLTYDT